jgi:hypothetical protein
MRIKVGREDGEWPRTMMIDVLFSFNMAAIVD